MYLHIPSILVAYLAFFIVFVGSCLYLWKGERRDDNLAHSAAEIGVLFTALTIVEGSIWGKPTWGVWWTWDARLTLTAILLLIFSAYLLLRSLIEDPRRGAVSGAILGIIGFLDIPLIHMSVYWWRTLHQPPSILRPDKAPWENIDPAMLWPLGINFLAFLVLFFYLLSLRIQPALRGGGGGVSSPGAPEPRSCRGDASPMWLKKALRGGSTLDHGTMGLRLSGLRHRVGKPSCSTWCC